MLTSRFATIGPVPLSLFGAGYYLAVLVLAILSLDRPLAEHERRLMLLAALTGLGFLTSLGLVYVQIGILHAICAYCMLSATTSTLLFVTTLVTKRSAYRPRS